MSSTATTRGALFGLGAALTFGMSPPLSKLLLGAMSPVALTGLLYLGGALALLPFWFRRRSAEALLRGRDWTLLGAITVIGGALAPALMLTGLAQVSALSGSLLLNLEAPFTMIIAITIMREHLDRRSLVAGLMIIIGSVALAYQAGRVEGSFLGAICIAAACLGWAIDNNLTQRLSLKDPIDVARMKTLGAGIGMTLFAGSRGELPTDAETLVPALLLGAVSYGASLVLDTLALRHLGAAREAAFFATAPFVGALLSVTLLSETLLWQHLVGALFMIAGVIMLLRAKHAHEHLHEEIEHEHAHTHDEHHQHQHTGPESEPPFSLRPSKLGAELEAIHEPHSHPHKHAPLRHAHPHVSDLHHRHKH